MLFRNLCLMLAAGASGHTLAPGEWLSAIFVHYYPDQKGLRAAWQASPPAAPAAVATGDFRKTGYMDVRLDGLKNGKFGEGVEVTVTVRNKRGERLSLQHDWQTYTVLGSDGEEYRTDGNHYGTSRTDRLASTVWLENGDEAKRTHVFPGLPFGETATRLIIREYGKEVASFELPK